MELFCSESVNELAGAMLKVQAEINPAVKDGDNPFAHNQPGHLSPSIRFL